jgi:hypothetical protein
LPSSPAILTDGDYVLVPENYSLSFTIKPSGIIKTWTNVLLYTNNNGYSGRIPGILLFPNSLFMHIRFNTQKDWNEGLEIYNPLPLNATTTVRIEAIGKTVTVYFNDTLQRSVILQGSRISGYADRYVNDPWTPSANAVVNNIDMKPITEFSDALQTSTSLTVKADTAYSLQPCLADA